MSEPPILPDRRSESSGSELVVFENSGHFAPVEEPEAFEMTVLACLGAS